MKIRYLLKEQRIKRGFSTRKLAAQAKIHHTTINSIELCRNDGSIENWIKIQKALKIKDCDMWEIITATKYLKRLKKIQNLLK